MSQTFSDERITKASEALLQCGTGQQNWSAALETVRQATQAAAVSVEVYDAGFACHSYSDVGVDPASVAEYLETIADQNPRVMAGRDAAPGDLIADYDFISETEIDAHPFYDWLERRAGVRYFIGACAARSAGMMVTLSVHRSAKQGHAGRTDIDVVRALLPSLSHAVALEQTYAAGSALADLESASRGVIMLSSTGIPTFVNAEARRQATLLDAFRISTSCFELLRNSDEAAFRGRVASLLKGRTRPQAFRLARRSGAPDYLAQLVRLPESPSALSPVSPRLLLTLVDPLVRPCPREHTLMDLFSLTRTEACVTRAVTLVGPDLAAKELKVSLSTLRVHLSRVYRKACVRDFAELREVLARLA